MSTSHRRVMRAALGAACATALFPIPALAAEYKGPSSSEAPYLHSVAPGVSLKSLITTGDAAQNGYRFGGIPDGVGTRVDPSTGRLETYNNQELGSSAGVVRAHGQKGSYVSHLSIQPNGRVVSGNDLIQSVKYWDYASQSYVTGATTAAANPRLAGDIFEAQNAAFARFCSSSLAKPFQLRGTGGRGYAGDGIYFANEENGDNSRVLGVTLDGEAQQLPRLGKASWENHLMAPGNRDTTTVIGTEDGGDGQLWLYEGRKQASGDAFRRAGLKTGTNFVIDVDDPAVTNDAQFRATYGKGVTTTWTPHEIDWDQSAARQNAEAKADGLTLTRIEDAAFDPKHPNTLYFITTAGGSTAQSPNEPGVARDGGGLWKLTFDDQYDPSRGGTLTLLLDGTEAPYLFMPDNIEVDSKGNVLIQEDPGNNAHVARILAYRISTGQLATLAQFNEDQFKQGGARFLTQDEESSGITYTSTYFGPNSFVFDAQVHKASADPELVEGGQLLWLKVRSWDDVYAAGPYGTSAS